MPRILLAEDDPALRAFLVTSLERAGHHVIACSDGLSACDQLEMPNANFDLLLTDIVMPGMDGIELSARALDRYPGIKVMYITGFGMLTRDRKPDGAEDAQVLAKPLHLSQLVSEIEKALTPDPASPPNAQV